MKRLAVLLLAAVPVLAYADARADVQAALERIIAAGGFRAHASGHVFGPDLPPVAGDIDAIFPDRIHARTESMEFIVTPHGAWVSALGFWTPADRSLLPVTAFDPREMRKAIASIRDVREDGRAKTSQCDTRAYRFRASGQLPGANADGDVRLWVCDGNGRPARIEASDAAGGGRVIVEFDWSRRPRVEAPAD
jgi:hypothetical protein